MPPTDPVPAPLPLRHARLVARALRTEAIGGGILLAATAIALVWANSPWVSGYERLRGIAFGPEALHLNLDLQTWAADGLLAIFFFVAGLELKHEIVHGELRHPRKALLPIVAAVAGMLLPAMVFLGTSAGASGALNGWAIPTATDIAFALAILAVAAPRTPTSVRAFLLTLAVVDDLGAILIIAAFYTETLHALPLLGGAMLIAAFGYLQRRRVRGAPYYVVIALVAWGFIHASGIHATVAGVALGLVTRVTADPDEEETPGERAERLVEPVSAGIAVPLFALLSAGVSLAPTSLASVFTDRVGLGIVLGLVVGKFLGVFGGAWLACRLGLATLSDGLRWGSVAALGALAGVGFTVSLLISELAYAGTPRLEHLKAAVLIASCLSALVAVFLLRVDHRRPHRSESVVSPRTG